MDPLYFFLRGKFIPKIDIFGDFGGHKATFLKPQWWKLATSETIPNAKFCKNCLRRYTHLGKIYTKKLLILAISEVLDPHF